ncbi:MAG: LacI family DNA-binding transcriptional regulator [Anaerolineae bacterium]|nr:LacI family DNA-binding transcriptional regulator [Anaerolineae bacterium]
MPTLEDVARRAGVSTATVSKVLSNTPYFTEETRQKVMLAVRELGYVPNLAARALSSGRTHIIAVVFPYVFEAIFSDPLTMRILQGIEAECSQRGYNMLLSTPRLTVDGADDNYLQLVQSGYLDGVIALDSYPVASALQPVHDKKIPAVAIGYHHSDYYVRSTDQAGGCQLMQHVLDLGHRHIGIIGIPDDMHFSASRRMAGLREAASTVGLELDTLPHTYGDWSMPSGVTGAIHLLTKYPNLTALICLNDRMAMGAIQQAHAMGRHVPDNLTVVGYDDIPTAALFAPPLTTIDQRAPELGQLAARMLFGVLNGDHPESIELPTYLIPRQSSARVPD